MKRYHVSKNLFNYNQTTSIIDNSYINQSGTIVSDSQYYLSYPITVESDKVYTWRFNEDAHPYHNAPTVGFYDNSDNLISVADHAGAVRYFSFTTPSNCAYIRTSVFKAYKSEAMLNVGSQPLNFEPYGSKWQTKSPPKYGTASEIITPPTTIYADGTAISTYSIKGNTVQSGTPTPSNPITISGVGNKTANLSSINEVNDTVTNGYFKSNKLTFEVLTAGTYTISFNIVEKTAGYLSGSIGLGSSTDYTYDLIGFQTPDNVPYSRTVTFTITQSQIDAYGGYVWARFVRAQVRSDFSYKVTDIMINTGSTALDFEPYGYKIPISSGGQTTPVYLGEAETTRNIYKLVLTGQESFWGSDGTLGTLSRYWILPTGADAVMRGSREDLYCTHYTADAEHAPNTIYVYSGTTGVFIYFYVPTADYPTLADYKAYIQQQYANGTPVTLYYILATPQTATVNEPLMKIGTYADSISNATPIPTTEGANTITVDTTVQPSEFTATWTGWHNASVQEYVGGVVNKFNYLTMVSGGVIGKYLNSNGAAIESSNWSITDYIPCNGTTFTLYPIGGNAPAICLYNSNKQLIVAKSYNSGGSETKIPVTITSSSIANYVRFSYYSGDGGDDLSQIMLVEGSTVPSEYHPYYEWVEQ